LGEFPEFKDHTFEYNGCGFPLKARKPNSKNDFLLLQLFGKPNISYHDEEEEAKADIVCPICGKHPAHR
jgi:hypothetical protein